MEELLRSGFYGMFLYNHNLFLRYNSVIFEVLLDV